MSEEPEEPQFPALTGDEIHKSLDDIVTMLASHANHLDKQTKALNQLGEVSIAARQAAFTARDQTAPKKYGELVGATIDGKINDNLVRMSQMCVDLL